MSARLPEAGEFEVYDEVIIMLIESEGSCSLYQFVIPICFYDSLPNNHTAWQLQALQAFVHLLY